jgi:hypothetical protein
MQCKEVESVLEREGFMPVPAGARAHVAGCSFCQGLVTDLTEIVATAHLLPTEVEPPARIWHSVRTQLETEGIIRSANTRATWWQGFSELFRSRALATVAVGFAILAALALQIPRHVIAPIETRNVYGEVAVALNQDERGLLNASDAPDSSPVSSIDAELRQNLQIVDNFIADCEQRLKEEPADDFSREYLSGAYQQKAELLAVMMERGESGK